MQRGESAIPFGSFPPLPFPLYTKLAPVLGNEVCWWMRFPFNCRATFLLVFPPLFLENYLGIPYSMWIPHSRSSRNSECTPETFPIVSWKSAADTPESGCEHSENLLWKSVETCRRKSRNTFVGAVGNTAWNRLNTLREPPHNWI